MHRIFYLKALHSSNKRGFDMNQESSQDKREPSSVKFSGTYDVNSLHPLPTQVETTSHNVENSEWGVLAFFLSVVAYGLGMFLAQYVGVLILVPAIVIAIFAWIASLTLPSHVKPYAIPLTIQVGIIFFGSIGLITSYSAGLIRDQIITIMALITIEIIICAICIVFLWRKKYFLSLSLLTVIQMEKLFGNGISLSNASFESTESKVYVIYIVLRSIAVISMWHIYTQNSYKSPSAWPTSAH
jgi:hypothetical protein